MDAAAGVEVSLATRRFFGRTMIVSRFRGTSTPTSVSASRWSPSPARACSCSREWVLAVFINSPFERERLATFKPARALVACIRSRGVHLRSNHEHEVTMRVAAYARVPTSDQHASVQLDALREYVARQGWQ